MPSSSRPTSPPSNQRQQQPFPVLQTAPTTATATRRTSPPPPTHKRNDTSTTTTTEEKNGSSNQNRTIRSLNSTGAKFGTLKYRLLTERYAEEQEVLQRCYADVSSSSSSSSDTDDEDETHRHHQDIVRTKQQQRQRRSTSITIAGIPTKTDVDQEEDTDHDEYDNDDSTDHEEGKFEAFTERKKTKKRKQQQQEQQQPAKLHRSRSIRILEEQTQDSNTTALQALRRSSSATSFRGPLSASKDKTKFKTKSERPASSPTQRSSTKPKTCNHRNRRPHGIMSAQRYDDLLGESGSDFDDMHLQQHANNNTTNLIPKREQRMREMHRACMWSTLVVTSLFIRLLTGKQRRFAALVALKRWFRRVILIRRTRKKEGLRAAYLPPAHSDANILLDHYRPTIEDVRDKYFPFLKKFDEMIPIHRPKEILIEEAKREREASRKRLAEQGIGIVPGADNEFVSMMKESSSSFSSSKFMTSTSNNNNNRKQRSATAANNNNNANVEFSPAAAALALRLNPLVIDRTRAALRQEVIDEERREYLKQEQMKKARENARDRFQTLRKLLPLISSEKRNTNTKQQQQSSPPSSPRNTTNLFQQLRARKGSVMSSSLRKPSSASPSPPSSPTSPTTTTGTTGTTTTTTMPTDRASFLKREQTKLQFQDDEYAELEDAAASWNNIDFSSPKNYEQSVKRHNYNKSMNNLKNARRGTAAGGVTFIQNLSSSQLQLEKEQNSSTTTVMNVDNDDGGASNGDDTKKEFQQSLAALPWLKSVTSPASMGFESVTSMSFNDENQLKQNVNDDDNNQDDDDDVETRRQQVRKALAEEQRKRKEEELEKERQEQERSQPPPPLSIILAYALLRKMSLVTGNHLTDILQQQQQLRDSNDDSSSTTPSSPDQQQQQHPVADWFLLSEGRIAEFDNDETSSSSPTSPTMYYQNTTPNFSAGGGDIASNAKKVHTKGSSFGWLLPLPFPHPQGQLLLLGTTCKLWRLTHRQFHEALEEIFDFTEMFNIGIHEIQQSPSSPQQKNNDNDTNNNNDTRGIVNKKNQNKKRYQSPTTFSNSLLQAENSMAGLYKQVATFLNDSTNINSSSGGGHHHHHLPLLLQDDNSNNKRLYEPKDFNPSLACITDTMRVVKNVLDSVTKTAIRRHLQEHYTLTPKLLKSVPMLRNVSDRALEGFCSRDNKEWSSVGMMIVMVKNKLMTTTTSKDKEKENNNNNNDEQHRREEKQDLIEWVGSIHDDDDDDQNNRDQRRKSSSAVVCSNNNTNNDDEHTFLSLPTGYLLAAANELNNNVFLPCGFGSVISRRKIVATPHAGGGGVIATLKVRAIAPNLRSSKNRAGGRGAICRFSTVVPEVEEHEIQFDSTHRGLIGAEELILPRIADTSSFVGSVLNRTLPAAPSSTESNTNTNNNGSASSFDQQQQQQNEKNNNTSSSFFSPYSTFVRTFLFPPSFDFACWRFSKKSFQKLILHDPVEFMKQRENVIQTILSSSSSSLSNNNNRHQQQQYSNIFRLPKPSPSSIPESIIQIKVPLFRFASPSIIRERVLPYLQPKFVPEGKLIPSSPLYADGIYIIVHGQVRRRRYGGNSCSSNNNNNNNVTTGGSSSSSGNALGFLKPIEDKMITTNNNNNNNNIDAMSVANSTTSDKQHQQQARAPLSIQETNILLSEGRPLREIQEPIMMTMTNTASSNSNINTTNNNNDANVVGDDHSNHKNNNNAERSRAGLSQHSFPLDDIPKHLEITESLAPLPGTNTLNNNNNNSSENQQHQHQHRQGMANVLVYECELRDPTTWIVLGGGWEGAMEHLPPPPLRKGQAELAPNEKWAAQWDSKWYCGYKPSLKNRNNNNVTNDNNNDNNDVGSGGGGLSQYTCRRPRSASPPPSSSSQTHVKNHHPSPTSARHGGGAGGRRSPTQHNQDQHQQLVSSSSSNNITATIGSNSGCGFVLAYFIPSSVLKDAFRDMNIEVKKSTVDLAVSAREFAANLHPQVISRVVNPDYFVPSAKQAQVLQKTMSYLEKSVRPTTMEKSGRWGGSGVLGENNNTNTPQQQQPTPISSHHPSPAPHQPTTANNQKFSIPNVPTLASSPDVFFDEEDDTTNNNDTTKNKQHLSFRKLNRLGSTASNNNNTNNNNRTGTLRAMSAGGNNNLKSMTSFLLPNNNNNTNQSSAEPVLASSYAAPQERKKTEKEIFNEKIKALFIPLVLPPKSEVSDAAKKTLKKLDAWGIDGREDNDDGHRSALKSMLLKQQQQQQHRTGAATAINNRSSPPSSPSTRALSPSSSFRVKSTETMMRSAPSPTATMTTKETSPTTRRSHISKRHDQQTFTYILDEHGNVQKKSTTFVLPPPQVRNLCTVTSTGTLEEEEEHEKEEKEEEERQQKLKEEMEERERRKQILGYYLDEDDGDSTSKQKQHNSKKKKKNVGFANVNTCNSGSNKNHQQQVSRKFINDNDDDNDDDDDLPFNSEQPDPDLELKELAKQHRDENDLILHEQNLTVGEKLEILLRESQRRKSIARAREGKHKKRDPESRHEGLDQQLDHVLDSHQHHSQSTTTTTTYDNMNSGANNNSSNDKNNKYELLPHERVVVKKVDRMIVSVVNGRVQAERKRALPYQGPRQQQQHEQHTSNAENENNKITSSDFFHTYRAPEPPSSALQASRHSVSINRVNETFSNTSQKQLERKAESARVISLNRGDDENTCDEQQQQQHPSSVSARSNTRTSCRTSTTILRFNGKVISSDPNHHFENQEQQQQDNDNENTNMTTTHQSKSKSKSILNAAMNFTPTHDDDMMSNNKNKKQPTTTNFMLQQQIAELSGETNLFKKKEDELRYRRPVTTNHATNRDWAKFEHCLMNLKKKKDKKKKKKENVEEERAPSRASSSTSATITNNKNKTVVLPRPPSHEQKLQRNSSRSSSPHVI